MIECEKCGNEIDEECAIMRGEEIYCERCYKDAREWKQKMKEAE